jgi:hypothetical protein
LGVIDVTFGTGSGIEIKRVEVSLNLAQFKQNESVTFPLLKYYETTSSLKFWCIFFVLHVFVIMHHLEVRYR